MTPSDPRHRTLSGYRAGCRQACCRAAVSRYNQQRKLRQLNGEPTSDLVPLTGTRRRLQALARLGYSGPRIAEALGLADHSYLNRITSGRVGGPTSHVATRVAAAVAALYDDLADQHPTVTPRWTQQGITRAVNHAKRRQWLPPAAWDDPDTDTAPIPYADRGPSPLRRPADGDDTYVDHVTVDRILDGDTDAIAAATTAERRAAVARCTDPRTAPMSLKALGRLTGWNIDRTVRENRRTASTTDQSGDTAA